MIAFIFCGNQSVKKMRFQHLRRQVILKLKKTCDGYCNTKLNTWNYFNKYYLENRSIGFATDAVEHCKENPTRQGILNLQSARKSLQAKTNMHATIFRYLQLNQLNVKSQAMFRVNQISCLGNYTRNWIAKSKESKVKRNSIGDEHLHHLIR